MRQIKILDGGMIFELNKVYTDYGQQAINENTELIKSIYQDYINLGCQYITTCNYGFTPSNVGDDWYNLTKKSIEIMKIYRNETIKIMGCLPPFFKSYYQGEVNEQFVTFYECLIDLFKDKVDYYLIETNINYVHADKIVEIIKSKDPKTKIIVSIYPNINNEKDSIKYTDLNVEGIFLNCCSYSKMKYFFEKYLKNNMSNKIFGFYCNKINESKYKSTGNNIKNLFSFLNEDKIDNLSLQNFLDKHNFNDIFIGGCCGYGVTQMKDLIHIVKTIK